MGGVEWAKAKLKVFSPASDALTNIGGLPVVVVVDVESVKRGVLVI